MLGALPLLREVKAIEFVPDAVQDMVAPFLYRRLVTQARITRPQVDELATALLSRWGS